MAEAADDLSTPLGQTTVKGKRRLRLPFTATQALAVLLGLFLVTFVGFALFNDNPLGGEPAVRVAIRQPAPADEKSAMAPSSTPDHGAKSAPKQVAPGEQKTVTIIDGSSGARHDMVIGSDGAEKAEPDAAPPRGPRRCHPGSAGTREVSMQNARMQNAGMQNASAGCRVSAGLAILGRSGG